MAVEWDAPLSDIDASLSVDQAFHCLRDSTCRTMREAVTTVVSLRSDPLQKSASIRWQCSLYLHHDLGDLEKT
jgi:hypothetical protein